MLQNFVNSLRKCMKTMQCLVLMTIMVTEYSRIYIYLTHKIAGMNSSQKKWKNVSVARYYKKL